MIRMFVRHEVEDFDTWKKVYDDFDQERTKEFGVKGDAVFQSVENPQDVTVWHDFQDVESARTMIESDRLRAVMDRAGVAEEPTVWFTEPT